MSDADITSIHEGSGRTKVFLSVQESGADLIVRLFNEQEHVGAVALSEYHNGVQRASTSVLTRFGHKDDSIAYMAAHRICRRLQRTVCAVAGIHLDAITEEEIGRISANCDRLVERYLDAVGR
jgi:hypothetical protein